MPAQQDRPTATAAGRYPLGRLLGRGGMADVYASVDQKTGTAVAVKVFRTDVADVVDRHGAEVRLLASLRHPNLVELLDSGSHLGREFMVMTLVEGPTLRAACSAGRLAAERVARIGAAVSEALAYVHSRGVVHRDVKPDNILLGPGSRVRLADFGIARLVAATRVTSTGVTVGTASYLAPEQVTGGHISPATDVYALGLVLLECLTGRREYDGTPLEAALARLHRGPRLPADLSSGWTALLTALTASEPASRPSAADAAAVLRRLAVSRAGSVPPPAAGGAALATPADAIVYQLGTAEPATPSAAMASQVSTAEPAPAAAALASQVFPVEPATPAAALASQVFSAEPATPAAATATQDVVPADLGAPAGSATATAARHRPPPVPRPGRRAPVLRPWPALPGGRPMPSPAGGPARAGGSSLLSATGGPVGRGRLLALTAALLVVLVAVTVVAVALVRSAPAGPRPAQRSSPGNTGGVTGAAAASIPRRLVPPPRTAPPAVARTAAHAGAPKARPAVRAAVGLQPRVVPRAATAHRPTALHRPAVGPAQAPAARHVPPAPAARHVPPAPGRARRRHPPQGGGQHGGAHRGGAHKGGSQAGSGHDGGGSGDHHGGGGH